MKEDIFNPRIVLERFIDAGMISVIGGHCSDLTYKICSGKPWASAYKDAFKLAQTTALPLWYEDKLLYDPNALDETEQGDG